MTRNEPDPTEWAAAKAERDAAIETARLLDDPEERLAAIAAAKAAWAEAKAKLLGK